MEVMSGVIPLDFRREEIAIRDIGKINSYSTKIPIKNQLDKWRRKETTNNIDPLLQTGCFSSVVSSSTNSIAPAPHGPGLLRHEPSVNAIAVFSILQNFPLRTN
jgi:hypothetical protein